MLSSSQLNTLKKYQPPLIGISFEAKISSLRKNSERLSQGLKSELYRVGRESFSRESLTLAKICLDIIQCTKPDKLQGYLQEVTRMVAEGIPVIEGLIPLLNDFGQVLKSDWEIHRAEWIANAIIEGLLQYQAKVRTITRELMNCVEENTKSVNNDSFIIVKNLRPPVAMIGLIIKFLIDVSSLPLLSGLLIGAPDGKWNQDEMPGSKYSSSNKVVAR